MECLDEAFGWCMGWECLDAPSRRSIQTLHSNIAPPKRFVNIHSKCPIQTLSIFKHSIHPNAPSKSSVQMIHPNDPSKTLSVQTLNPNAPSKHYIPTLPHATQKLETLYHISHVQFFWGGNAFGAYGRGAGGISWGLICLLPA
jgi:hypothetical protein